MQYFGFDRTLGQMRTFGFGLLEWLPTELFSTGAQGAFYLPEPENLFQDAAMTIPVTASGDPVGAMMDLSGNGNSAKQSVSTNRLIYSTNGTFNWIAFDGVDDFLQATYGAAVTPPCTLSLAMNRLDTATGAVLLSGPDAENRHQISISGTGTLIGVSGSSVLSGSSLPIGKHIITLVINGADSSLRVDGIVTVSGTLDDSVATTGLTIGAVWFGSYPIRQDVYGIVHAEGISKVSQIESYLAQKSGVTL